MPKSLQDVAEVHYGKSQNGVADKYGHFPIIGTGGFLGYARKPLFSGPAIVVGRKGTLNNPIYSPDDFWAVDTTYAVVPKENIHPKWLYFTLKNARLELLNEATGVPSLSRDRLFRVPVQDIEFPEQSRIAYILDAIDEAIAQTESVIAKLKQVRAGMLHNLLSYGLDEHGQLRDPVAHPEQFKDSPLGLIPREWDVVRLVDRAGVFGGKRLPSGHSYADLPTGYRYLRVLDFFERSIAYDELAILRKDTFAALSRYEIHDGELFISIAGSLGFVGVLRPETTERYILTENAARISILRDLIPEFLSLYMNGVAVQKQINAEKGIGAGVPKLALHRIERLWVAQPKPAEQETIVSITAQFDRQLGAELIELRKLESLKSGLQNDLLTGRVRVPETIMEGAESA